MGQCSEVADDGENLEDHPRPRDQIRPPQDPVSACKLLGRSRVEPFSFGPRQNLAWDIASLGEYACAAKRPYSACAAQCFSAGAEARPAPEFGRARGLKYLARRFYRAYARRSVFSMESWNFAVPLPFLRRSAGDSMNHKGVEHTLTRSQTPGVLAVAISDRRPGQVGIDRGTACAVGHAPRRAENRSRTEARSAPTDVLIGVRLMGVRAGTPGLSLLGRCPDTDQIL
jgi:hypothetical protein